MAGKGPKQGEGRLFWEKVRTCARPIYGNFLLREVPRKDSNPVLEIGHFARRSKKVHGSNSVKR